MFNGLKLCVCFQISIHFAFSYFGLISKQLDNVRVWYTPIESVVVKANLLKKVVKHAHKLNVGIDYAGMCFKVR